MTPHLDDLLALARLVARMRAAQRPLERHRRFYDVVTQVQVTTLEGAVDAVLAELSLPTEDTPCNRPT